MLWAFPVFVLLCLFGEASAGQKYAPCTCNSRNRELFEIAISLGFSAYTIRDTPDLAISEAKKLFPTDAQRLDSFRHCYWSCLMVSELHDSGKSYSDAVRLAKTVNDIHEACNCNAACEHRRDLHNNMIGRQTAEKSDCRSACYQMAKESEATSPLMLKPPSPPCAFDPSSGSLKICSGDGNEHWKHCQEGRLAALQVPWTRAEIDEAIRQANHPGEAWKLTWADEFDGDALDTTKWNVYDNQTHGDKELQLYVKDEVSVSDGHLVLTTSQRDAQHGSKLYHYTSGWIDSEHKFSQAFGRFEIRAKLPSPKVHGMWPAHWLMPEPETSKPPNVCWPVGGEIDILEMVGFEHDGRAIATFHWADECGKDLCKSCSEFYPPLDKPPLDLSLDFHVYAVEWNTTMMMWFVDDFEYHRVKRDTAEVPQTPFYVILNTALCWWDPPQAGETFPQEHVIDYVRVYER